MPIGDIFKTTPTTFVDKESGYTVLKPISQDQNRHMYFTSNPFTREGDELIFSAIRGGVEDYFRLNYTTGEYVQLTDIASRCGGAGGLKHYVSAHFDKNRDTLYYAEPNRFYAVNIRTLETKLIYESPGVLHSLSPTCDGRYIVSCDSQPVIRYNNDQQELNLTFYRMFKVDLATGEETTILYRNFPFYHLQCSPTDPELIMYCAWGFQCTHHRIWYTNIDGSKGGPLGPELPNEHRTHEYFTPDGKQVAYHGKFFSFDNHANFKNINHTWGIMNADGTGDKYWSCLPRGKQAGHSIVSHDGKLFVADGDGYISFVKLHAGGTATFEPIVAHNSTMSGNFVHPHPSFSNDDRYVIYATDSGGQDKGNIYMVDLWSKAD